MEIHNFHELKMQLGHTERKTVVVAAAHDLHALQAVFKAHEDGLIQYLLVGDEGKIRDMAARLRHEPAGESIIRESDPAECGRKAVALIKQGRGDFLLKGKITTAQLLKAVVDSRNGIRESHLLSHVAILEIPGFHKLVGITDAGMVIRPDLNQKKEILKNAVDLFRYLGYKKPKVAVMTAIEYENPKMPETCDAARLKQMNRNGEIRDCVVEGPISFDIAISKAAAEMKDFESEVSGEADIMLVPDIVSGNLMTKGILYTGKAVMAGCVMGAKVPIALTSRAASFQEKYQSLVLCAAMCMK